MTQRISKRLSSGLLGLSLLGAGLVFGSPSASAADPVAPTLTCPAGTTFYGPSTPTRMAVFSLTPFVSENLVIPIGLNLKAGERLNIVKYLSWDGYPNRASAGIQVNEQWAVRAGSVVSSLTEDIPDGVIEAQTTGSLGSIVATTDAAVELAHHGALGPTTLFNSVYPVGICASVDKPYDLKITKTLLTAGPFQKGSPATFRTVVTNNGPGTASGWEMVVVGPSTGLLPKSLAPTVAGTATCNGATGKCVSTGPLAPGASVTIDMMVTVDADSGTLKCVAYVEKAPSDLPELIPLGTPPTNSTDTAASTTNNDAEASLTVTPGSNPTTTTPATTTTTTTVAVVNPTTPNPTTPNPNVVVPVVAVTAAPAATAASTSAASAATTAAPATTAPAAAAAPTTVAPTTAAPTTKSATVAGVTVTSTPEAPVAPSVSTEPIAYTGGQNLTLSLFAAILMTLGSIFLVSLKLRRD
jgi:Domain of unknown function DUF11